MTEQVLPPGRSIRRESGVAVLNGLNIVAALASQLVIYRMLGVTAQTDAYVASVGVPQMVLAVMTVAASGVVVPMLASQTEERQDRTLGSIVVATFTAFALPLAIAIPTAARWVPIVFPGLAESVPDLIVSMVQVQMLSLPLVAVSMLLTARWQARQRFVAAEAVTLALTLATVVALLLALPRAGALAAAWLFVARYALQVVVLGAGVNWQASALSLAVAADAWQRSRLLLAGNLYFKSDLLVDRYLLSTGPVGSLALFSLAQTMVSALAGVIGQAWGSTAVPPMAAAHARGDQASIRALVLRNARLIVIVAVLAVPLAMLSLPPLLSLLTGRELTTGDGVPLWALLLLLGGVPVFGAMGALVTGCFYASGDARTPTLISAVTFTLFVAAKVWVTSAAGLQAFCLLTSAYFAANAVILGLVLRRRLALDPASER